MSRAFVPIADYYAGLGNKHGAPVVKCPDFWQCGEYADMARLGSTPTKVELRCKYHARKVEEREGREMLEREPNGSKTARTPHEALLEFAARTLIILNDPEAPPDAPDKIGAIRDSAHALGLLDEREA